MFQGCFWREQPLAARSTESIEDAQATAREICFKRGSCSSGLSRISFLGFFFVLMLPTVVLHPLFGFTAWFHLLVWFPGTVPASPW